MSQNLSYTLDNKKLANFFKWLRGEKVNKNDEDTDNDDDEYDEYDRETNEDKTMQRGQRGARKENAGKAETDDDGYMTFSMPW